MIETFYGIIPLTLLKDFCRIVGYRLENHKWTLISDQIEHFQHVPNKPEYIKKMGWIPVRDYNFQYAMLKNDHNIEKALKYADDKLFDIEGKPIYLPDELAIKAGLSTDIKHYSYSGILKELKETTIDF